MYQHIDPEQPRQSYAELLRTLERERAARKAAQTPRCSVRPALRRSAWQAVIRFARG